MLETSEMQSLQGNSRAALEESKQGPAAVRHSGENSRRKSGGSPRAKDRKNQRRMERRIRG